MAKVKFELEDRVGHIIIDSPPVNALNQEVLQQLSNVIDQINEDVDVVIISGAGEKAFVAGADIREFPSLTRETGIALCRYGQEIFTKIEKLPQPVIAAIEGFALGGGLELALACDFRIATVSSKLGLPEVKLGIIPGYGGTQRLARLIGIGKAKQLIFSGEFISGEEAYTLGLIEEVTDSSAVESAKQWAEKIKQNGLLAVAKAKQAINEGIDLLTIQDGLILEARLFGELADTADKNEGVAAFLEKRLPRFSKS